MRRELEAQQVSPFKHAVVIDDLPYMVERVIPRGDRVRIHTEGGWSLIRSNTQSILVEIIDDGDDNDPDPGRSAEAQVVHRRAAKPSWRMGRRFCRSGWGPLYPR